LLEHFDIPITYDNLHDKCNPDEYLDDAAYKCARTWGNVKPLFHYSESMPDHKNPRKHADMPTGSPFSEEYDWDIELKSKDAAIRACAAFQELGYALAQPFKSFMESDIKDYYPTKEVDKNEIM